ncbi:hypothetical protein ACLKA7_004236 [Drosophila subpalustris]
MFAKLFVLFSVVALIYAQGIVDPDDEDLGIDGRIYGGVDTPIDRIPCQVSLQRNGHHFCGGSIYKANVIVTAAHCVHDKDPRQISVRAGSDFHSTGGFVIPVTAKAVHELYDDARFYNDVALLLLSSPLKFGPSVKAISLASSEPDHGAKSLVSGWGETETEYHPRNLKSVNVNIISRKKCALVYANGLIRKNNICAGAAGKDSCEGDSGGPLIYMGKLVGIVSWGYRCGNPHYTGVYANVPQLRNWIEKNTDRLISTQQK